MSYITSLALLLSYLLYMPNHSHLNPTDTNVYPSICLYLYFSLSFKYVHTNSPSPGYGLQGVRAQIDRFKAHTDDGRSPTITPLLEP